MRPSRGVRCPGCSRRAPRSPSPPPWPEPSRPYGRGRDRGLDTRGRALDHRRDRAGRCRVAVEMGRERFEELVGEALDDVPAELLALMDNVVVLVEDDPEGDDPDLL